MSDSSQFGPSPALAAYQKRQEQQIHTAFGIGSTAQRLATATAQLLLTAQLAVASRGDTPKMDDLAVAVRDYEAVLEEVRSDG